MHRLPSLARQARDEMKDDRPLAETSATHSLTLACRLDIHRPYSEFTSSRLLVMLQTYVDPAPRGKLK